MTTSKSSKVPHKLFHELWKECEDGKTKAPSKSGKSKKCKKHGKSHKPTNAVETDAKDTVAEVAEPVLFDVPVATVNFDAAGSTVNGNVVLVPSDATDEDGNCVTEADAAPAGSTVNVAVAYYAVVDGNDASYYLPTLDLVMATDVANSMFTCGKARRSLVTAPLRQGGRALEGDGVDCVAVDSSPTEKVDNGQSCPESVKVEADQSCHVVQGGLMLTVSDSSDKAAAERQAYGIIEDGFNSGKYAGEINGLETLIMKSPAPAAVSSGLKSSNNAADTTAALSPVAAAMLSVGLIAFIALALVALRHKRKRDRAYNEFYDDDHDLFAKDTSSTDGSSLGAYVVDGVNGNDILDDLALQHRNQVDVHHCNSATCQICNGRQTTFIETGDNDTISEMYPDQFEIENDRTKSFEYFSRPDASSPEFSNPANIRPRLYEVEDTVSL